MLAGLPDVGTRLMLSLLHCVGRIGRLEWTSDCPICTTERKIQWTLDKNTNGTIIQVS